jgi:chorismate mutase
VPATLRALRGATTVEVDAPDQVTERVQELLREIQARNDVHLDDVVSVIFTATADVVSMFPATAARGIGFGAVPLLCALEIPVPGSMPRCLRVLMHVHTTRAREELHHVYLHGAQVLRDDLPL